MTYIILISVPFPPSGKCHFFIHICLNTIFLLSFSLCSEFSTLSSQTFLIIMWWLPWPFCPFPIFISQDRFLMLSEHLSLIWCPSLHLPQSNPSLCKFNFLLLLCFLELIQHLFCSLFFKSNRTDTWHLPLDKNHHRDNSSNYPWLFLSSFCTPHYSYSNTPTHTNLII